MCHLFPSLSPWNVYDLELRYYIAFAAAADEHIRQNREAASRG